ncbi:type IV pilus secretin PilQ [Rodentibacter pneumotropicus]|uniref:Type IV pilus secretin PilQ n=1 Tax=Rodentibacter pneumotropicus TaxID=758 RepID=A0A4S2PBU4_9PAST|nr:type IV pilus secretin PilQ [Rodentibacter pneumotropicus]TGZ99074.1 type IV pilus secretin PilQ [Rodentibacter pneumotropicus]THA00603.1 type IV pilus secretin PilQ [Rodentibacter pneumotropicus]THA06678.1 type IV pilus secretin PilQ [Rodentibacter pneumotropicus]THA14081.1 type IV pilus secretin PilQ [Rodentibacter pneumotropicus]
MNIWLRKCGLFLLSFYWGDLLAAELKENQVFSIRLKQAPIVSSLQELALDQGTNLIIEDELEGSLSLQLDNVDFDRVLQSVAKMKGLALQVENGIYYLGKQGSSRVLSSLAKVPVEIANEIAEPMKSDVPTLVSKTIKLHFAKASEVMKSLTTGSGSLLSAVGSITFDDRSNVLIIQDEAKSVKNLMKLIAELDKPIEQIAIEARIVTITDESLKELGVRWGIFTPTENAHQVSGGIAANGFANITDNLNVNFATNTTPAGSLALQVAKINGRLLDLELTALERENNVEIIASPRLLTTNKKSASIKQGTEIPYVVTGKNDIQTVEFREAVLGLEVTPHISKDNNILLDLLVSQNSPGNRISYGQQNNEIVSIDKQEINTQVFARDGETIVLGGVFHDTITKGIDKVPVLGDIPLIKRFFSKESERHQKRELVIFVTPRILKQGESLEGLKQKTAGKPRK